MSDEHLRIAAVQQFIEALINAAIDDERESIADYAPGRNRGQDLMTRLNLASYRVNSRHGDRFEARRIYNAARFLYRTETAQTKEY